MPDADVMRQCENTGSCRTAVFRIQEGAGKVMYGVTITELIQKMNLKNIIPEIDTDKVVLSHPDVNRPALQLAGFFDHFDKERVQIIGFVEQEYIKTLSHERKVENDEKILASEILCLVFSRSMIQDEDIQDMCRH